MKENALRVFLLFSSLHYGMTEVVPSIYSPHELVEWANKIELLIKTGYVEPPEFSSNNEQCAYSKPHNDYIFEKISPQINEVWNELESQGKTYQSRRIALADVESDNKYKIDDEISEVRRAFKGLIRRLPTNISSDIRDLCSYASTQLTGDTLRNKIDGMFEIVTEYNSGSDPLSAIADRSREPNEYTCNHQWTPNEFIYSIYSEVLATEMAGFITIVYSYWYLYKYNNFDECSYSFSQTPDEKIEELHEAFEGRIVAYTEKFLLAIKNVFNIFRKCKPQDRNRDETIIELEGAIQTVPLPDIYYERQCAEVDMTYGVDWRKYCQSYPTNFRCLGIRRPCFGHISKCKPRPSGEVCLDKFPSPRRYKWIATKGSSALEACPNQHLISMSYGGRTDCVCRCVDNQPASKSIHIFNLQHVEADVTENKVVTGVKIVVDHRIVHLQIKQGKLLRNWQVEDSDWKPIIDISEEIRAHRLGEELRGEEPNVTANVDYLVISEDQPVNLDKLLVPPNHVLTGVKFHYGADEHLQVAILTRPFNPATGELSIANGSNIVTGPIGPRSRNFGGQLPSSGLDTFEIYDRLAGTGYVVMTESDLETDSGQSTVPFFDARPVESNPASIMGGINFAYSASENSGFALFSLELISFDYEAYMEESLRFLANTPGVRIDGGNYESIR